MASLPRATGSRSRWWASSATRRRRTGSAAGQSRYRAASALPSPSPPGRRPGPGGRSRRLASGLAIGGAPYLLARLADTTGLRPAYLLVPVLLLGLAAHATTDRRHDPIQVRHDREITRR